MKSQKETKLEIKFNLILPNGKFEHCSETRAMRSFEKFYLFFF